MRLFLRRDEVSLIVWLMGALGAGMLCVVGVGLATTVINSGDEIEVDGTKGVVTVFKNQ